MEERLALAAALLQHELDLIARIVIDPLGRRYTASKGEPQVLPDQGDGVGRARKEPDGQGTGSAAA